MARLLVTIMLGLPVAAFGQDAGRVAAPDTAPIQPLGRFSDMRYTEEHAYGYSLELWHTGSCLFGLFGVSEGLAGDTPTGRVSDPTRDLFVFKGRLGRDGVQGMLRRSDRLRAA